MDLARRTSLDITYNGKQATKEIEDYIESFSYTDVASGESDSISLTLLNIDKKWMKGWLPKKGDSLSVSLVIKNWEKKQEKKRFRCGTFTLDEYRLTGRPLLAELQAVSMPVMDGFRATERSKSWNRVSLEAIAQEIAKRYHLKLIYDANPIMLDIISQSKQTDSAFLYELCETYGIAMKVYASKLILYDEAKYERKKAVVTLQETDLLRWEYCSTLTRTYTAAEISYTNPEGEKEIKIKVGKGNRVLKLSERADSLKDAELKAVCRINQENKKATTMQITIMGNPKIVASSNILIRGLEKIDGKYAVNKVQHLLNNKGYTMKIEIRLIQDRILLNSITSKVLEVNDTESSGERIFKLQYKEGDKTIVK